MIRAGSGLGRGEPEEAGRTAARMAHDDLDRPSLAFVFVSDLDEDDVETALAAVREVLGGNVRIVGCSGAGLAATGEEVESEPAVSVVAIEADKDSVSFEPFLVELAGKGSTDADAVVRSLAGKVRGPADRAALVLLPSPSRFDAGPFFARVRDKLGKIPISGGLPASAHNKVSELVFLDEERSTQGAVGVLISGPRVHVTVAVAQGCRPLVPAGEVTRAERNLLLEIDGKPALARLKEALEKITPASGAVLCGIALDPLLTPFGSDDFLARNVLGVDPKSGAVAIADHVPPGARVTFLARDASTAREDLALRAAELKTAFTKNKPSFALYFNCVARGSGLYGDANVDAGIIRAAFGEIPIAGFFGNGELAPLLGQNHVFGYTGVLLVVGER